MKSQFRHFALYCLFIVCACFSSSAVFAAVTNQASISYADPKTGTATKPSNEVKTLLSETISYYTSSGKKKASLAGSDDFSVDKKETGLQLKLAALRYTF